MHETDQMTRREALFTKGPKAVAGLAATAVMAAVGERTYSNRQRIWDQVEEELKKRALEWAGNDPQRMALVSALHSYFLEPNNESFKPLGTGSAEKGTPSEGPQTLAEAIGYLEGLQYEQLTKEIIKAPNGLTYIRYSLPKPLEFNPFLNTALGTNVTNQYAFEIGAGGSGVIDVLNEHLPWGTVALFPRFPEKAIATIGDQPQDFAWTKVYPNALFCRLPLVPNYPPNPNKVNWVHHIGRFGAWVNPRLEKSEVGGGRIYLCTSADGILSVQTYDPNRPQDVLGQDTAIGAYWDFNEKRQGFSLPPYLEGIALKGIRFVTEYPKYVGQLYYSDFSTLVLFRAGLEAATVDLVCLPPHLALLNNELTHQILFKTSLPDETTPSVPDLRVFAFDLKDELARGPLLTLVDPGRNSWRVIGKPPSLPADRDVGFFRLLVGTSSE